MLTNVHEIDRKDFGGALCRCKIRKVGDMKNCLRAGHQGIFGEVKEFGRQQLQDWHDAHASRAEIRRGHAPVHNAQMGFG
jgi:hypothetical protein